jgi:hypothetical protein
MNPAASEPEVDSLVTHRVAPKVVLATIYVLVEIPGGREGTHETEIARQGDQLLVDGTPAVWVMFNAGPEGDELQVRRT